MICEVLHSACMQHIAQCLYAAYCTVHVCSVLHSACMQRIAQCMYAAYCTVDVCSVLHSACMQHIAQCLYAAYCTVHVCSVLHSACMQRIAQCMYAAYCTVHVCSILHSVCMQHIAQCLYAAYCTVHVCSVLCDAPAYACVCIYIAFYSLQPQVESDIYYLDSFTVLTTCFTAFLLLSLPFCRKTMLQRYRWIPFHLQVEKVLVMVSHCTQYTHTRARDAHCTHCTPWSCRSLLLYWRI